MRGLPNPTQRENNARTQLLHSAALLSAGKLTWKTPGTTGLLSLLEPFFSEAAADELLVLLFVRVSLAHQSGDLLLEVVHLLQQLGLLALQDVPLLDPLVAARLGIASVFEGPPLLFEPDHLLFADPPQVPVELTHGHGHQLLVREAIVQVHVLVADGVAAGLHAGRRMVSRRVVVMVVVVVRRAVLGCGGRDDRGDHRGGGSHLLAGHGASSAGCACELLPSSIAVEALELVTAVDQRLHRVLGAEAQSLWVELLLVTGHPVEILQMRLLFAPGARAGRREAWGRGNRAARRAHRGGRQGSPAIRRLHWLMLRSGSTGSFFTSNFIRSKSLTYSMARGLVGRSELLIASSDAILLLLTVLQRGWRAAVKVVGFETAWASLISLFNSSKAEKRVRRRRFIF